jgi:hypothetical protein
MKIALALIGVLVLGVAGYFGNEYRACSALEDDYLNAIADMRGNIAIRSLVSDPELDKNLDQLDDLAMKRLEASLMGLHDRCGKQSADNAHRKGQDMLLGI